MFKKIKKDLPNFYDDVLKEVGARFLSEVIPLTPTGKNFTYQVRGQTITNRGGTLKRGWIGEVSPGPDPTWSDIENHVQSLPTTNNMITISNAVEYAIFVNYGHLQEPGRFVPAIGKRLKKHWVDGIKFKEEAEHSFSSKISRIYENKLKEYYRKWSKE